MNDDLFIKDGVLMAYRGDEAVITVPQGVTEIGEYAFSGCETVETLIMHEGVKSIGRLAFRDCVSLRTVKLPESLERLGQGAFMRCCSLTEIALPGGVTELPRSCFNSCEALSSVLLPAGLCVIGDKAFSGCISLKDLTLPHGLKAVGDFAFEYCTGLTSLVLPEGLRTIGRSAFYHCRDLRHITVPGTVDTIGSGAFYTTPFLEEAQEFLICGGGIFVRYNGSSEQVTVPQGVRKIGEDAFAFKDMIKQVILPEGVTEICMSAFERCSALERIDLPQSLKVIGGRAFGDCSSLEQITLPRNLRFIGCGAFGDCSSLSSIELSDGIGSIGEGAFERTPLMNGDTLILAGKYLIRYCGSDGHYRLPEGVTLIAGGAFDGNTALRCADLSGAVSVGEEAFRGCSSLREVFIPATVRDIGGYAFSGIDGLRVTLERSRRQYSLGCFDAGQELTFTDGDRSFTVRLLGEISGNTPEHALLDFAAQPSQSLFRDLFYPEYMIPAALCYADPGGDYESYLRENIVPAVKYAVDLRDSAMLQKALAFGCLTERQTADCAAYAIEQRALEQQVMIMRCKQERFGGTDTDAIDDRFDW